MAMDHTGGSNKTPEMFEKGGPGGPGRKRKQWTKDVEDFVYDALNIKGVRMMVECMTSASKTVDGAEVPDWKERRGAFNDLRDTFIGRPAQVITGEDGAPLIGGLGAELIASMANLAK